MTSLAQLLVLLAIALLVYPRIRHSELRMAQLAVTGRLGVTAESQITVLSSQKIAGVATYLVALLAGLVSVILLPPLLTIAAGALIANLLWALRRGQHQRRQEREDQVLLEAVSQLAAELRSGARPAVALKAVAGAAPPESAVAQVLQRAARASAVGEPVSRVFAAAHSAQFAALAVIWRLSESEGVALAELLGRIEDDLEASRRRHGDVVAAIAAARSSSHLLAVLPILGLLLGESMQAHPWHFLRYSFAGNVTAVVGVGLDITGLAWSQRIIARARGHKRQRYHLAHAVGGSALPEPS